MKQRKEFTPPTKDVVRKSSDKTVQELTSQVTQIIGKNPEKASKVIEFWVNDPAKARKKIA